MSLSPTAKAVLAAFRIKTPPLRIPYELGLSDRETVRAGVQLVDAGLLVSEEIFGRDRRRAIEDGRLSLVLMRHALRRLRLPSPNEGTPDADAPESAAPDSPTASAPGRLTCGNWSTRKETTMRHRSRHPAPFPPSPPRPISPPSVISTPSPVPPQPPRQPAAPSRP